MKQKYNGKPASRGFTLTEILVVVLIISVLAAVVYPLYTKSITKSRAVEAINLLEMVRNKQLEKFARDGEYHKDFHDMGQLTSDVSSEKLTNAQIEVRDYTLSLNPEKNCMNARYQKGSSSFTFSSSYETAGLGCTGSICTSFGDIIGDASSVCNCGSKQCSGGYTLNPDTCACECNKGCESGGQCKEPSGGGLTRPCQEGCGVEYSQESCNGAVWTSGSCKPKTLKNLKDNEPCGNGGTRHRNCYATCDGGVCDEWGPCSIQDCTSPKPRTEEDCGKCGTRERHVTCDQKTGTWSVAEFTQCQSQGECYAGDTRSCGNGGTQTCSSSCGWGTCVEPVVEPKEPDPTPDPDPDPDPDPIVEPKECTGEGVQVCGKCGSQARTCDTTKGEWSAWGTCKAEKECKAGETQSCGDGNGTQTCSESCGWGECACSKGYEWNGTTCKKKTLLCTASKPTDTKSCAKCAKATRTVSCDTETGEWVTGPWGECNGGGVCDPGQKGAKKNCGYGDCPMTMRPVDSMDRVFQDDLADPGREPGNEPGRGSGSGYKEQCPITVEDYCSANCQWTTQYCPSRGGGGGGGGGGCSFTRNAMMNDMGVVCGHVNTTTCGGHSESSWSDSGTC